MRPQPVGRTTAEEATDAEPDLGPRAGEAAVALTRRGGACRWDGEEVDEPLTVGRLLEEGARRFIAWAET
jgi:hypothetical protein